MPWLASRLRESVVIASAMLGTALLFAVYPLTHTAWGMGGLSVLLGITLGSVQPMIMSTLHQITPPHRRGQALGLRALAINGSSVVMPLLFGSAGVVVGVAGVFWTVGAVTGLGARLALGLPSATPPPPKRL
jgi:MFS family permease